MTSKTKETKRDNAKVARIKFDAAFDALLKHTGQSSDTSVARVIVATERAWASKSIRGSDASDWSAQRAEMADTNKRGDFILRIAEHSTYFRVHNEALKEAKAKEAKPVSTTMVEVAGYKRLSFAVLVAKINALIAATRLVVSAISGLHNMGNVDSVHVRSGDGLLQVNTKTDKGQIEGMPYTGAQLRQKAARPDTGKRGKGVNPAEGANFLQLITGLDKKLLALDSLRDVNQPVRDAMAGLMATLISLHVEPIDDEANVPETMTEKGLRAAA